MSAIRGLLHAATLCAALFFLTSAQAQRLQIPDAVTAVADPVVSTGAIGTVGPGDTLSISVLGQGGMDTRATVDMDGDVVVPMLGTLKVIGLSPSAIGRRIADGLRRGGYLQDPQVSVEVLTVRSRVVSVLGQVERPGRYPIDNRLSVLELLAMVGGTKNDAGDTALLIRRGDAGQQRMELYVSNRQSPSHLIQDTELQPGDVVFVPQAPRFFVSGEVGRPGAYPIEPGLTVMRALSLAGGLTPRASDRRIDLTRTDVITGEVTEDRVKLNDQVKAGDVILVNERIF